MKKNIISVALLCTLTLGCVSTSNEVKQPEPTADSHLLTAIGTAVADSAKSTAQQAVIEQVISSNPLIGSISDQLGLSQTQAEGGLSSILGFAQSQMPQSQFTQLSQSIPNIDSLLAAAPDFSKVVGNSANNNANLSGLMNNLNQGNQVLALLSSFQEQGLSTALIQPMIQIVISFLTEQKQDTSSLSQLAALFKA